MSKPVITIRKVSKHYGRGAGRQQVLYDVSVEVLQGELVSIVGTSGSGKSTLLNVIGGLDREYVGAVNVLEEDYGTLTDKGLARLRNNRIGFVFQAFNLLPRFTALGNVELPLVYSRLPARRRREKALAALAQVGLADRIHHRPRQMSGGEQQRVAIARALVTDPAIILADEPTGNLDSASGGAIMDILVELNRSGKTVIIVTHERMIADRTGRIIRLLDGRVLPDGERAP
jgi:putative ABC transport system ATP-binding protein